MTKTEPASPGYDIRRPIEDNIFRCDTGSRLSSGRARLLFGVALVALAGMAAAVGLTAFGGDDGAAKPLPVAAELDACAPAADDDARRACYAESWRSS